jgi:hypothetical protein
MQRSTKILAMTITATLISATAMAQTLAQRNAHTQAETALASDLASTNTACATSMTASFDWTNFDKLPFPLPFAPTQHSHDFVYGVQNFCSLAATNKAALKPKVQKLLIVYGGEGKGGFALAGGTFTYTIDPKKGSPNPPDIRDFLGSHL